MSSPPTDSSTSSITGLVAMLPVADVERSISFYRLLGLEVGHSVPSSGPKHWAWLYSPAASDWKRGPNLMLTRAANVPAIQSPPFLLYLYITDLDSLRQKLLADGLSPGEICYPEYLPKGEFALSDPDGYTLMLAQSATDTP